MSCFSFLRLMVNLFWVAYIAPGSVSLQASNIEVAFPPPLQSAHIDSSHRRQGTDQA